MLQKNNFFSTLTFSFFLPKVLITKIKRQTQFGFSLDLPKRLKRNKPSHFNKQFVFFSLAFSVLFFKSYYSTKIKSLAFSFWLSLPAYNKKHC